MSILGIGPELSHYNTRKIHTFTKQSDFLSNTGIKSSDTVHISNKGKGLARNGFHVDISDPKIKADIEAIVLPDWFGNLLPKEAVSTPTLGTPYTEMYKETGNEKAVSYCKTKLSDVLCEESLKTGISSEERYSMKKTQPDLFKDYDEKLHQAVRNRLSADEKYVKYMDFLGISI